MFCVQIDCSLVLRPGTKHRMSKHENSGEFVLHQDFPAATIT